MLHRGDGEFLVMCSFWSLPNIASSLMAKRLNFGLNSPKNLLPVALGVMPSMRVNDGGWGDGYAITAVGIVIILSLSQSKTERTVWSVSKQQNALNHKKTICYLLKHLIRQHSNVKLVKTLPVKQHKQQNLDFRPGHSCGETLSVQHVRDVTCVHSGPTPLSALMTKYPRQIMSSCHTETCLLATSGENMRWWKQF